jgi:hypothetical protein
MKPLIPLALLAVLGPVGAALAQAPLDQDASQVQAQDYHYGMALDIQKVIHISDNSDKVGVVPTTLTYLDSQGRLHKLNYLDLGGYDRGD